MDLFGLIQSSGFAWSPLVFGVMVGLATALVWQALAPGRPKREVEDRLEDYLGRVDPIEEEDLGKPLASRTVAPLLRRVLRALGRFAPKGSIESTQKLLTQAGDPGGLGALDFLGLRLLCVALFAAGYYFLLGKTAAPSVAARNTLLLAATGYFLPLLWLRRRARGRQHEIERALPDALDMMTVGVEAGLAFESALVKVGERWDNALTRELRRVVIEMRLGTARDVALRRLADRTAVDDLHTFVAVLVQSTQLGVSIAQVLHSQAAQMRERRRQRAEELARQASVKMVFPLVFLIFPAMFIVILGPAIPAMMELLRNLAGGV